MACLSQTGQGADGDAWPLFTRGWGGGFYTPVFLYFGALWTKLWGVSLASMRSIAGIFNVLTILGVYVLGRRVGGRRVALYATVLACLSPWSFQFSRIAWDPPLAPAFLIWGAIAWLFRRPLIGAALAGILFVGAMYSYPPFRFQAPMLFLALFFLAGGHLLRDWKRLACFVATALPLSFPLYRFLSRGDSLNRTMELAIFSPGHLAANQGHLPKPLALLQLFGDNVFAYLRPSFLFFRGDANPRHSVQVMGQLGLLDDFALLAGAALLFLALRGKRTTTTEGSTPWSTKRLLALAAAGIFSGIATSALTWEGSPHALRSIGCWPFYSLLGGTVLTLAQARWKWMGKAALGVGCAHAALYGWIYFQEYPRIAGEEFTGGITREIRRWDTLTKDRQTQLARDYREQFRFLRINDQGLSCVESETLRRRYAD